MMLVVPALSRQPVSPGYVFHAHITAVQCLYNGYNAYIVCIMDIKRATPPPARQPGPRAVMCAMFVRGLPSMIRRVRKMHTIRMMRAIRTMRIVRSVRIIRFPYSPCNAYNPYGQYNPYNVYSRAYNVFFGPFAPVGGEKHVQVRSAVCT